MVTVAKASAMGFFIVTERDSESMIHTLVYEESWKCRGIAKLFKFNKQSDEYDPQVIVQKTQTTFYVMN